VRRYATIGETGCDKDHDALPGDSWSVGSMRRHEIVIDLSESSCLEPSCLACQPPQRGDLCGLGGSKQIISRNPLPADRRSADPALTKSPLHSRLITYLWQCQHSFIIPFGASLIIRYTPEGTNRGVRAAFGGRARPYAVGGTPGACRPTLRLPRSRSQRRSSTTLPCSDAI
jgi:hypothetical protein